jgi:hypothetical protein
VRWLTTAHARGYTWHLEAEDLAAWLPAAVLAHLLGLSVMVAARGQQESWPDARQKCCAGIPLCHSKYRCERWPDVADCDAR